MIKPFCLQTAGDVRRGRRRAVVPGGSFAVCPHHSPVCLPHNPSDTRRPPLRLADADSRLRVGHQPEALGRRADSDVTGDVTGDVIGDVNGDVIGDVNGDVIGDVMR